MHRVFHKTLLANHSKISNSFLVFEVLLGDISGKVGSYFSLFLVTPFLHMYNYSLKLIEQYVSIWFSNALWFTSPFFLTPCSLLIHQFYFLAISVHLYILFPLPWDFLSSSCSFTRYLTFTIIQILVNLSNIQKLECTSKRKHGIIFF